MEFIDFSIRDTDTILSPGLVIFRQALQHNLDEMIRQSGGVARLRPHCKTHKMAAVALAGAPLDSSWKWRIGAKSIEKEITHDIKE